MTLPLPLLVAALVCGAWVCLSLLTGKTLNLWRGGFLLLFRGPFIADREADAFFFWASVWMVGTFGAILATLLTLYAFGAISN